MKYERLHFFSDSGHGWLRVPLHDVQLAMLQGLKLTKYSYQDSKHAYLEEDLDAPSWINFRKIPKEIQHQWKVTNGRGYSTIRNKQALKIYENDII